MSAQQRPAFTHRLHRTTNQPLGLRWPGGNSGSLGSSPSAPSASGRWSARYMRDLPVLGRAQGGDEGNLVMEESAIDWTFRPASLEGVNDAFAVVVTGDSMSPKYAPGDLVYVNPAKQLRKGCFVLVELAGHRGLVKQFDRWDGDMLFLQQYNPFTELTFERAEVLRVLPIIGSMDA